MKKHIYAHPDRGSAPSRSGYPVNQSSYMECVPTFERGLNILGPSKTVPGQTLSLEELLRRHVRGENIQSYEPVYTAEPLYDGIENLNTLDKMDYLNEVKSAIKQVQAKPTPAPPQDPPPSAVPS